MSTKKKGLMKPQLDRMKAALVERRHRLQDELRGMIECGDGDDPDRTGDEGDLANLSLRSEIAVDVRARESRELQMVEDAMRKVDEGTYGSCEDCGTTISLARLEALPFAQFCIECQEKNEVEGSPAERREFQTLD